MLWTNRQRKEQRMTADQYSADNWGDIFERLSPKKVRRIRRATLYLRTLENWDDNRWAELHDAAAEWKEKKRRSAVAASSSYATFEAEEVSDGEGGIVLSD